MQAIKFKNWTNEDFTWSFDKIPYTFGAGQEMYLEDYKAKHFAKHLVDREMNKLNIPTNMEAKRKELEVKCFPSDAPIAPEMAIDTNEKKAKAKKVVEEFPDLKTK